MRPQELLLEGIARSQQAAHSLVDASDADTLNRRPDEHANSITWLVWHLARQQDAQIAALVLDLMGNVDIVRLARNVGQIQEIGWKILETGNLLALGELLPVGLDLASVALGVLRPGQKMSPELLGAGASAEQVQLATALQGRDFGSVLGSVSTLATSQGATDLTELIGEGLDAASFLTSGSHTSYASKKLVEGRTAIDWLYQFFRQALGG